MPIALKLRVTTTATIQRRARGPAPPRILAFILVPCLAALHSSLQA